MSHAGESSGQPYGSRIRHKDEKNVSAILMRSLHTRRQRFPPRSLGSYNCRQRPNREKRPARSNSTNAWAPSHATPQIVVKDNLEVDLLRAFYASRGFTVLDRGQPVGEAATLQQRHLASAGFQVALRGHRRRENLQQLNLCRRGSHRRKTFTLSSLKGASLGPF
jgi:hypothetical protein